jgi:YggT family protein
VILHQLTEPILMPVKRHIPPIAGIDLSPIVVLVILQLINITLVHPLALFALRLTVGMI